MTSAENYEAGLPLGLIYATSKDMLKDRVSALRDANIYEPQRYRHLISGVRIERVALPPKLVKIGKRLVARPTAPADERPSLDIAALIDEERNRWP